MMAYDVIRDETNVTVAEEMNAIFNGEFEFVYESRIEPVFYHMRNKNLSIDVIGVRGTKSISDVYQDLSLFGEISILQGLQWFIPFLSGLPVSFVQQIISYASWADGYISDHAQRYDEPVLQYIATNHNYMQSNVIVVGHSLGGGIAQLVAAKLVNKFNFTIRSFGINRYTIFDLIKCFFFWEVFWCVCVCVSRGVCVFGCVCIWVCVCVCVFGVCEMMERKPKIFLKKNVWKKKNKISKKHFF